MPPPALAELAEIVVLVIDNAAGSKRKPLGPFLTPPPRLAELPEMVLLVIVNVPSLKIPPPPPDESAVAVLAEIVLLMTVNLPWLRIPPPIKAAELPEMVLLVIVSAVP